jgi:peptidoglycan/LPS O-acetylase OafA/YrhL
MELDTFCKYFVFFALGYVAYNEAEKLRKIILKLGLVGLISLITLVMIDISGYATIHRAVLSILAIPSVLYLGEAFSTVTLLQKIGKESFVIYLWNSVFIFGSSYILAQLKAPVNDGFHYFGFLLLGIGLFVPLLLKKLSNKSGVSWLRYIIP